MPARTARRPGANPSGVHHLDSSATSGALVARLLDPPGRPRAGMDLLVEHGFALRLSARHPRSARPAWWSARYELRLVRVVPRTGFAPVPAVARGALS